MTHPNQQQPRRLAVSQAPPSRGWRGPREVRRMRRDRWWAKPRRGRTGPGPRFPADPAREPTCWPPNAKGRQ